MFSQVQSLRSFVGLIMWQAVSSTETHLTIKAYLPDKQTGLDRSTWKEPRQHSPYTERSWGCKANHHTSVSLKSDHTLRKRLRSMAGETFFINMLIIPS